MRYHQQRRAPRDARGLARAVRDIGGLAIRVHPGTDAGPGVSGAHRDAEPVCRQQRSGPHIEPLGRQDQRTRPHMGEPHLRYRDHSLRPKIAQHPGAAISERGGEIPDTEESGTTAPRTTISTAMLWKTATSSFCDTMRQPANTAAKGLSKSQIAKKPLPSNTHSNMKDPVIAAAIKLRKRWSRYLRYSLTTANFSHEANREEP